MPNLKKQLNILRRKSMRRLTRNIGARGENIQAVNPADIKRILVCRPNHRLGNLLLITPLLQEIEATFPGAKVDLFIKGGLGPVLFCNYKIIDKIIQLPRKPLKEIRKYLKVWAAIKTKLYDITINVDKGSSSGRISTQLSRSAYKFFGEENEEALLQYPDHIHIAKQPVYNFRLNMQKLGMEKSDQPIPALDLRLSTTEKENGKKILSKIVGNEQKTICLFTYATGEKCYSPEWWKAFYNKLLTEFPRYNIMEMLPVENISMIDFKAPSFYSKDVREMSAVMRNTSIFIGADSGIMHLASASLIPTVGLFSVSNASVYAPYHNKSIALNTNETSVEDCIAVIHSILDAQIAV